MKFFKFILICLSFTQLAYGEVFLFSDIENVSQTSTMMEIKGDDVFFTRCNAQSLDRCVDMGSISLKKLERRLNDDIHNERFFGGVAVISGTTLVIGLILSLAGSASGMELAGGAGICFLATIAAIATSPSSRTLKASRNLKPVLDTEREQCKLGLSEGKYQIESYGEFEEAIENILK